LIDSRAQENFINSDYIKKHHLLTFPLKQPIKLHYADRSSNPESTIETYINLQTQINNRQCDICILVTRLAKKTLILEIPFLEQFNPDINWK
ncbi:hypothetical protein AN958_01532, partial [Leucoagaricus sp. SymC.cos]